jgi:integral membrane protein
MNNNNWKSIQKMRIVGIAEGVSFLVLLLIAMPLKYYAGYPEAVKLVGWAHGILFIGFIIFSFDVKTNLNKSFFWFIKSFVAALIPCGTFILDKELKKDQAALAEN